jgi:hypothetical protein
MPTILPADKTDREVVTYVHRRGSNVRIQLEAIDDLRDARGRTMERGKTLHAHFNKGLFTTNIAELQDGIENSYAYAAKEVEKSSVMQARAIKQQLDSMIALAEKDPELAAQLRSRLTSMQMAAKATKKGEKGEPTGEAVVSDDPA